MEEPTSGPWEVAKSESREFYMDEWYIEADALMDDGVPGMVAIVNGEANARLIAEAPETAEQRDELLAALEQVSDLMWSMEYNDSLKIIDAAIAKAKGEAA